MRKLCAFWAAILVVALFAMPAASAATGWDYLAAPYGGDVQAFIEEELVPMAGTSPADWFVLALATQGGYDLAAYGRALEQAVDAQSGLMTDRQRQALVCIALGVGADFAAAVGEDSLALDESRPITQLLYGLMLCSALDRAEEAEPLAKALLSLQLEDGGFALMGQAGDVDVTAMALQALAPFGKQEQVHVACEAAFALLANRQNEQGGFDGFGNPHNAESCAQVVLALFAWDKLEDPAFVKNGRTPVDVLGDYAGADGSIAHNLEGDHNDIAASQVLLAFAVSAQGEEETAPVEMPVVVTSAPSRTAAPTATPQGGSLPAGEAGATPDSVVDGAYKPIAAAVMLGAAALAAGVLAVRKKLTKKRLFAIAAALLALLAANHFVTVRTPAQYAAYKGQGGAYRATVGVVCSHVLPEREDILAPSEISFSQGETVFDLLTRAAAQGGFAADESAGYVRAIDSLREMDHGGASGWVYTVNGAQVQAPCTQVVVEDGDTVLWYYTLTLGEDVP